MLWPPFFALCALMCACVVMQTTYHASAAIHLIRLVRLLSIASLPCMCRALLLKRQASQPPAADAGEAATTLPASEALAAALVAADGLPSGSGSRREPAPPPGPSAAATEGGVASVEGDKCVQKTKTPGGALAPSSSSLAPQGDGEVKIRSQGKAGPVGGSEGQSRSSTAPAGRKKDAPSAAGRAANPSAPGTALAAAVVTASASAVVSAASTPLCTPPPSEQSDATVGAGSGCKRPASSAMTGLSGLFGAALRYVL